MPQFLKTSFGLIPNIVLFSIVGFFVSKRIFRYVEQSYAEVKKKPLFLNFILIPSKLNREQIRVLDTQFQFYKRLNSKERDNFRHRVAKFISDKNFYGREDLEVTEEMRTLISATAVMLTFGFKDYSLPIIKTILIYPSSFYSKANEQLHKGEVNPMLGVIAFSWEDFKHGYDIENDNLNLGIHEFGHALHLNSYKKSDVSALIFRDAFKDLKRFLKSNDSKREELIKTKYFREYAYTNEFEFVAVLIECFFETPEEFKSTFPNIYDKVKEMLNFNFADY
ncbi:zinc-dependent peptidase [Winogradskyella jejuensis]|nr:zinc-dependent peptidase [Winogradskyella jejuensis]